MTSPANRSASTHSLDVQSEIKAPGTAIDPIIPADDYSVVSNLQNQMAVNGLAVLWEKSDEVITFVRFFLNAVSRSTRE